MIELKNGAYHLKEHPNISKFTKFERQQQRSSIPVRTVTQREKAVVIKSSFMSFASENIPFITLYCKLQYHSKVSPTLSLDEIVARFYASTFTNVLTFDFALLPFGMAVMTLANLFIE